jgi:hypothetical protein
MDERHEMLKLERDLQIPVNAIRFETGYVSVLSGGLNIGSVPFYSMAGILSYDTSEGVVNRLNWAGIYLQNRDEIHQPLAAIVENEEFGVTCGGFRVLFVKDFEGQLLHALICSYDGNHWTVRVR